jgi:hypothetical protein
LDATQDFSGTQLRGRLWFLHTETPANPVRHWAEGIVVASDVRHAAAVQLSGQAIINELIRNMEMGQFEMAYSVLLPCVFDVYLHADDHARLAGIIPLIVEDARKALGARVTELNRMRAGRSFGRSKKPVKEYRIASTTWIVEFHPDTEDTVPPGDVEIHSELNELVQPEYRGTKTTLLGREPSVTSRRTPATTQATPSRPVQGPFAEIRYEDDSGPQVYAVTQNLIRVGRGGDDALMDVALYTGDEVSREHMVLRRDAATGQFLIIDRSTNGTWVNGRRLKKGVEEALPERADIGVAEVLTLAFEAKK